MTPALRWLTARWLRRRSLAVVPIGLLMAAGVAATMLSLAAAERTATAFGDYLDRANVGDVVVNPSTSTREIDEIIRSLPNVEQVTTRTFFLVTNDDGHPRPRGEIEAAEGPLVIVVGSDDGQFDEMDRPAVRRGRLPTEPSEAVIDAVAAELTGLGIGDVVPLAFWEPDNPVSPSVTEVVEPIGVERVTIVGVVTRPDGVLPDDLFRGGMVIVSPDVAARYDCPPAPTATGSRAEIFAALTPPGCSTQYRYYSLAFAGGAGDVGPALEAFGTASRALAEGLGDVPFDFSIIPTGTAQLRDRVDSATRPTVTALVVLGAASATITATSSPC